MKKIAFLWIALIGILFLSSGSQAQNANKMMQMAPKITDLKLGTGVQDKQIVGEDSTFAVNTKVYVWMKITGAMGDSIMVNWKHADKEYKAAIEIGGSPWRTWNYKTVTAAGSWTVTVTTASREVLKEVSFTVK